jgi:hypothetical protein
MNEINNIINCCQESEAKKGNVFFIAEQKVYGLILISSINNINHYYQLGIGFNVNDSSVKYFYFG